jgi:hypothetical protein
MSLTTTLSLTARGKQSGTVDLGSTAAERAISASVSLTNGTGGAGLADLMFADTRTLSASATEDLDLAGALADAFGTAQVFARVKALVVQADAGNTNNVLVSRPASNGFGLFSAAGDQIIVRPGETFAMICGVADAVGHAVTAATGDLLTVTNSGGTTGVTYSIMVIGCSS